VHTHTKGGHQQENTSEAAML